MANIAHLLVASDLTERAIYPLQRAMQLKAESDCQVTVLHVVEHGLTAHIRERRAAEALDELKRWKEALPALSQIALNVKVSLGDPFAAILEAVHTDLPDLSIVGQPGKPNLKEFFTGTTAERVMRFSERPVLMVNQYASGPYKRVLVAVDFSESARQALDCACRIAPQAEIRVVHVWRPPVWGRASDRREADEANQRLRTQEEQQLRTFIEHGTAGRRFPLEIVDGEPEAAVREALGRVNADLLALGTHARGRTPTALIGSLAREFLVTAPCDVLVARA